MDGNGQPVEATATSTVLERKAEEIAQSLVALTAEFTRALAEVEDAKSQFLQELNTTREEQVLREAELAEAKAEVDRLKGTVAELEARPSEEEEAHESEPVKTKKASELPAISAPDGETIEEREEAALSEKSEGEEQEEATTTPDSEQTDLRDLIADRLEKAGRSDAHLEDDAPAVGEEAASEEPHLTTRLKRRNRELIKEKEHLLVQVDDLNQQLSESSAEIQRLTEEKENLESQLAEARDARDTLETAFAAAQDKIKEQEEHLEQRRRELSDRDKGLRKLTTSLRRHERKLEVAATDNVRLEENLQAAADENTQLRQDLDAATAERIKLDQDLEETRMARQHVQHDLEICESARQQLILQIEELQQEARRIREQSGWETASTLVPVLTKLSTLAGLEPQQTKGLSERAVFEEFRDLIARKAGGRLEAFPTKQEMTDKRLWLDPDQIDLADLLERYDWSPDHPFEGLPEGQRRLAFRVSRRGWSVGGRVLARARVVPEPMPSDTAPTPPEGEASDAPEDS